MAFVKQEPFCEEQWDQFIKNFENEPDAYFPSYENTALDQDESSARNPRETCSMPIYSLYITPSYNHMRCLHPKFAISLTPQTSSGLDCKVEESPSIR